MRLSDSECGAVQRDSTTPNKLKSREKHMICFISLSLFPSIDEETEVSYRKVDLLKILLFGSGLDAAALTVLMAVDPTCLGVLGRSDSWETKMKTVR